MELSGVLCPEVEWSRLLLTTRRDWGMAKSKYETHVLPHLEKIEAWAKQGATAKEIARKLSIAYSTFRKYIDEGEKGDERYAALSAAFARACKEPDEKVEAALFKRACGYQYTEVTEEEKLDRDGRVHKLKKTVVRDVPPDPTSAMFWLANRRKDRWQYKPDPGDGDDEGGGVVMMAPVMENPGPPVPLEGGGDDA